MLQGWSYVGDRLLSAVIPYEESGWYDGQMWVKPPEVSNLFVSIYLCFFLSCEETRGIINNRQILWIPFIPWFWVFVTEMYFCHRVLNYKPQPECASKIIKSGLVNLLRVLWPKNPRSFKPKGSLDRFNTRQDIQKSQIIT